MVQTKGNAPLLPTSYCKLLLQTPTAPYTDKTQNQGGERLTKFNSELVSKLRKSDFPGTTAPDTDKTQNQGGERLTKFNSELLVNFVSLTFRALLHPVPINKPADIPVIINPLYNCAVGAFYIRIKKRNREFSAVIRNYIGVPVNGIAGIMNIGILCSVFWYIKLFSLIIPLELRDNNTGGYHSRIIGTDVFISCFCGNN